MDAEGVSVNTSLLFTTRGRSFAFTARTLALTVGLASSVAFAQDQQPAGTTAPTQDHVPTATISNTPAKKGRKTHEPKANKKEEKVVQSKDTKKHLRELKKDNPLAGLDSTQPDKQLYDKALKAMKSGKFDVARLELQTLLATYPDSEYQMRAKLAFADSWYREGGSAAMAQAETEYKDFITFFPNAPEAAEAQMRVGDIYFKQMDTPDRDYTKALHAQEEYRTMLQQFPDSPLIPEAKQRLREVQEMLAEREFEIGSFYASRENYAAAIARMQTVADTYPLYSKADDVLIGLGDAYAAQARLIRGMNLPEGPKARLIKIYEDQAADAYGRVVTQYAAAPHVEDARDRLETLGRPIPVPTPEQLAASQALEQSRQAFTLSKRFILLVKRGPNVVLASRLGEPSLADPKPTVAPAITRAAEAQFKDALAGKSISAPAHTAPASTTEPAATDTEPSAPTAPASNAPLTLSDVPVAGAEQNAGSAADLSHPANTTNSGAGTGVGVEILSPGATNGSNEPTSTPPDNNGLKAVGPANTAPLPGVEAPAPAPDQINDVAGEKTPAAQAPPANGKKAKAEYDNDEASSSKHKKKKGIKKINPF
ncbi:MAG: outer membrane protein assembly factor BamD [Acidobacteria bacterium]|nr:outer membrane protein assembly factor BamD [Acidobacteriota bacterium]